jgi:hypothetical protein
MRSDTLLIKNRIKLEVIAMPCANIEEFIRVILDIVQDYAAKNICEIKYGKANQPATVYSEEESPHSEGILYYIISQNKRNLDLRFYETRTGDMMVVIDNGGISLTLNQDLGRDTTFPRNDFNKQIDNIQGDFRQRLMACLYMMQDWECALKLFYNQVNSR